jgi:Raf kinase inhibitor-like YbhB/YbcL family protein
MRAAYALLGLAFLILFGVAYILLERKQDREIPFTSSTMLTISSPSFTEGGMIPQKFTCDGENMNPELRISGAPTATQSFVLIMDDPDIPTEVKESMGIDVFNHWVLYNIGPETTVLSEGLQPVGALKGYNSRGKPTYTGPCPPDREHRYFFRLYALSSMLHLTGDATLKEIEKAMEGKVIETAVLMAHYARPGQQ